MPINKVYYLALVGSKEEGKQNTWHHGSLQQSILHLAELKFSLFILPATRTLFNDISPNTAYIYPIQNWNISFKVTSPTQWNHATSKREEVSEGSCVSQWDIACNRAEAEKAHCCLCDFPLSSETNLCTAWWGGQGRAGLWDCIRDRGMLGPPQWGWAGQGGP